ncbi:Acriflavin resistance protein [Rhodovulum sp. PH10]|uniref:efflux RND transporter permease subunit n=1 Tax=Rhodovulum sp. PH10 TaxID=1187851 RepID=UPI00027C2958|nr:efflux RND transporter permease subunit [Rhodovulum sp. PH10]EJW10728.1 Acriflavin resistance protein [Rhodovulum sp. PH10]
MRRFNVSAWAVAHPTLVLFLIIMLALAGGLSYERLGRAEDPSFTIKVAVVTAAWPGATAQEMQDQVADRIEKKLQELPYFYRVTTYSKPGFIASQMEFRDTTPPKEVPWLFYLLRKKMADLQPDLPDGVLGPFVNDEYGDVDSILYTLRSGTADYATLKEVAEGVRQKLLKVPDVTKVTIYGVQDQRIFVDFDHVKLATLGITPQAIFDSLAKQNAMTPAGTVQTGATRIPLRVTGALDGVAAVRETPVAASDGTVVRLGDIATVSRGYEDPPDFLLRQRGVPALAIGVVMQKGANILTLGENVDKVMKGVVAETPVGLTFERIADQPKIVEEAVGDFMQSFVEALAIVLAVSFLSLGWRTGIVVALSVPLVLAIVFTIMLLIGLDLHRVTLGALIIALGLLVDDAIIAVEMMVVKMEQGYDRPRAASFAWVSTAFPMLTGTLVTAAGFLPVGFAASATGEYAGGIFWVVAIALVASWVVAVVFTPYLGMKLLPNFPVLEGDPEQIYHTRIYARLRRAIRFCVRHRVVVVAGTLVVFGLAVVGFGRIPQQFFPVSERTELFLQIRMPEGTAIGATLDTAKKAESLIAGDDDAATWTTYVGQGPPRFWLGLSPALPNEAYAEIVIVARNVEARERLKAKIDGAVAEGALAQARVRVDRFSFGPPVGFPVQFRVIGNDPDRLRQIAYRVRDRMRQDPDVLEPQLDWNEEMPSVRLVLDQDRARALGLDPQTVAQTLQTLVSGYTVTTIRDGTEKVAVVARAIAPQRGGLGHLGDLTVLSRNGVPVPLSQVARIEESHEPAIFWRRNRDLAITVRTDIRDGVQAPDVSNRIWEKLGDLRASLPEGYRMEVGGAVEESAKANTSLFAVFPVMIVAMLTILMVQLQSFSRLGLVLLTAPLGLIGATLGLLVSGMPFGFVALLGLIALAGMIIRNTVILVDQIEQDVSHGRTRGEAIVEATVRRARPVVLTAMAAVLAMIPLSRSGFWGPMAVTIMGGLLVATALTLLFLPALYALWFRRSLDERGTPPADRDEPLPAPAGGAPALVPNGTGNGDGNGHAPAEAGTEAEDGTDRSGENAPDERTGAETAPKSTEDR